MVLNSLNLYKGKKKTLKRKRSKIEEKKSPLPQKNLHKSKETLKRNVRLKDLFKKVKNWKKNCQKVFEFELG